MKELDLTQGKRTEGIVAVCSNFSIANVLHKHFMAERPFRCRTIMIRQVWQP